MCLGYTKKLLLCVTLLLISCYCIAKSETFKIGEHYLVLSNKTLEQNIDKPKILVFFNYRCYACSLIYPVLEQWKKTASSDCDLEASPVIFDDVTKNLAKLYFSIQQYSTTFNDQDVFDAIIKHQQRLWQEDDLDIFLKKYNIDTQKFMQIYNSFKVDLKLKKAIELSQKHKNAFTPEIVILTKHNVYKTNLSLLPDIDSLLQLLNFLIKQ